MKERKINFLSQLISQQFFNSFHSFYRTNCLKLKVCNVLASDESRQFTQLVHSNFSRGRRCHIREWHYLSSVKEWYKVIICEMPNTPLHPYNIISSSIWSEFLRWRQEMLINFFSFGLVHTHQMGFEPINKISPSTHSFERSINHLS